MTVKMTRGQKNRNPLNIRLNAKQVWKGQIRNRYEKAFVTFDTLTNGFRAAFKTLKTYMDKYDRHTIVAICTHWAPENENNTQNYINVVSKFSKIDANENIEFTDKDKMVRLVDAMAFMENGLFFNKDVISKAYDIVVAESASK